MSEKRYRRVLIALKNMSFDQALFWRNGCTILCAIERGQVMTANQVFEIVKTKGCGRDNFLDRDYAPFDEVVQTLDEAVFLGLAELVDEPTD